MKEESSMKKVFGSAFVLTLFSVSAVPIFAGSTTCNEQITGQMISGSLEFCGAPGLASADRVV